MNGIITFDIIFFEAKIKFTFKKYVVVAYQYDNNEICFFVPK